MLHVPLLSPVNRGRGYLGHTETPGQTSGTLSVSTKDLGGVPGNDLRQGDVCVLAAYQSGNTDLTLSVADELGVKFETAGAVYQSDAGSSDLHCFVGRCTGLVPPTFAVSGFSTSGANSESVMMLGFRGIDLLTPQDAVAQTWSSPDTNVTNGAPITTATPGAIAVAIYGAAIAEAGTANYANDPPTGWINVVNHKNALATTRDLIMSTFMLEMPVPGVADPPSRAPGSSAISNSAVAITIALRPKY